MEKSIVKKVVEAGLHLLFPERCRLCGCNLESGQCICDSCSLAVKYFVEGDFCPGCGIPYLTGQGSHLCGECLKNAPLFSVVPLVAYEDPISSALFKFKYYKDGTFPKVIEHCKNNIKVILPSEIDLIIPVPLYRARLRKRGFNQAHIIARCLFPNDHDKICLNILERRKNTIPQTILSKEERKTNLIGAFTVKHQKIVRKQIVCLVDDVMTTGSTLRECAMKLIESGASGVYVVVFARTMERK